MHPENSDSGPVPGFPFPGCLLRCWMYAICFSVAFLSFSIHTTSCLFHFWKASSSSGEEAFQHLSKDARIPFRSNGEPTAFGLRGVRGGRAPSRCVVCATERFIVTFGRRVFPPMANIFAKRPYIPGCVGWFWQSCTSIQLGAPHRRYSSTSLPD